MRVESLPIVTGPAGDLLLVGRIRIDACDDHGPVDVTIAPGSRLFWDRDARRRLRGTGSWSTAPSAPRRNADVR